MTPAVTINATILAGGAYEPPALPGLAYLTGRVLDRGTSRRSADRTAEELDDRGVALRVATARHTMAVTCTCLSEDFDDVLGIVARHDRGTRCFRRPKSRSAAPRRSTPSDRTTTIPRPELVESLFELLYGSGASLRTAAEGHGGERRADHAFGSGCVSRCAFRAVTRSSLVIVGDVPSSRVFDRAAGGARGLDVVRADRRSRAAARSRRRPRGRSGRSQCPGKSQADIAYGFTTIRRLDPRYYALLGDEQHPRPVRPRGPAGRQHPRTSGHGLLRVQLASIRASCEGPLLIRAGVDPANVDRALRAIDDEVGALGAEGPTAEELEQSKEYLIGAIPRALETNAGIASFLQSVEQFGLGLDYDRRLPEHLRAVTFDEVKSAATEAPPSGAGVGRDCRPAGGGRGVNPLTRAVFFDVDFTLIYPGPTFQGVGYQEFCAAHGVEVDPAAFDAAVVSASTLLAPTGDVYDPEVFIQYTRRIIEHMGGQRARRRSRRPRHLRSVVRLPPLRDVRRRARRAARAARSRASRSA